MSDNIRELLDEEIESNLEVLKTLPPGSEEYQKVVGTLGKLHSLRIEELKVGDENVDRYVKREIEKQNFEAEMNFKREMHDVDAVANAKDQYIKYGLEVVGIVLPLIFYGIWMNKGFKFEETGSFTSTTFRGLIGKFKPKK